MTYYGYKNGKNYRFTVTGETSWACGNFYHSVKIEYKSGPRYYYLESFPVHCCEDALEAAAYIAGKMGVELEA